MSKKIVRLIALLLSAMMLFSLTACNNPGSGTETPSETEENENIKKLNEYFSKYPAVNMNGREIKIAMFYDMYYDSGDTKPEDNPQMTDMERGQLMLDNIRRIEEKYNCKITYLNPGGDAIKSSLNTSVVAGKPDYDVYLTQMDFALPLAVNGYFVDLSTFKADYLDLNNGQNILHVEDVAGKSCFFEKSGTNVAATYLAYNAEMIEEAGLEDPNDLYARGEWTWEKFNEYCTKLTQDTDNNGETDIYGYGGDLILTLQEFLASNNALLIGEDGKEQLSDPKVLETFTYLGELFSEKKVAKPIVDDYTEGLLQWINKQTAFGPTKMWVLQANARYIKFDYRIVPFPQGPNGIAENAATGFGDYFVIPRGVEDPELVYQVLEEFFGYFADDLDLRDEDMLSLAEGCFQEEADVETAFEIGTWGNGDVWYYVDTERYVPSIFSGVVSGEFTAAELVESLKQLFQDEIDAIFNP